MKAAQRIVSFLPAATEMICSLGLADRLVGITHECDYPPEVNQKTVVVRSALPVEKMSQSEIDAAVAERMRAGLSLYLVDEQLLEKLAPDLIVTQNLCQVCAPSGNEVSQILKGLTRQPQILWLTPSSLSEIFDNLRELGEATGQPERSAESIASGTARLDRISRITSTLASRPRVFCMEWFSPVYCSGHWMPEMVTIAGGTDEIARAGADSVRLPWDDVVQWAPEILVLTPCGFDLDAVVAQSSQLQDYPGWNELPAVRHGRVYAVDANSYFARPGPRVVDGTELLAHLIHPDVFPWTGPQQAYRRLSAAL